MKGIYDSLRDMFSAAPPKPDRNTLEQVVATYQVAGRLLAEKLDGSGQECAAALLRVCEEHDPAVIESFGVPIGDDVQQSVDAIVLGLLVRFDRKTSKEYERTIALHLKDDVAAGRTITHRETVTWDYLPSDVREDRILHDRESTEFQLYPRP